MLTEKYAKDDESADAMSIRITAYNRGPDAADLHILPQHLVVAQGDAG